MTIAVITRLGIAALLATSLAAAPALAQVAPGVGVGAGGASAGLGGNAAGINTTGAGTGMSAPALAGSDNHALGGSPAAQPDMAPASSGLASPTPNGGITPPVVGYNPGGLHHGMATPAGRMNGGNPRG